MHRDPLDAEHPVEGRPRGHRRQCRVAGSTDDELDLVVALFETVGSVLVVPEEKINAISAISGSGPAYVFYLIEQLTETAVGLGFERADAERMVAQTFRGASELLGPI